MAKIEPSFFESNPDTDDYLDNKIKTHFYAVQITIHKDFTLGNPTQCGFKKDGSKIYNLKVESNSFSLVGGNIDIVQKDKNGNVISDTKRDRLTKQKWLAESMYKHRHQDVFLDYMLKCYDSAVKEKKHELFHLYDIRDALQKRFGTKPKTTKLLGITNKEWDMLGNLANYQPLVEGRHKGKNIENLRSATHEELKGARDIALSFIEKYLIYLESEDD